MVTPPPVLYWICSPIFKGKFFLGIFVLFKGLLLCEQWGPLGHLDI